MTLVAKKPVGHTSRVWEVEHLDGQLWETLELRYFLFLLLGFAPVRVRQLLSVSTCQRINSLKIHAFSFSIR